MGGVLNLENIFSSVIVVVVECGSDIGLHALPLMLLSACANMDLENRESRLILCFR